MGQPGRNLKKQPDAQAEKFKVKARELECDEDERAFDKRLGKIAKTRPPTPQRPAAKRNDHGVTAQRSQIQRNNPYR